MPSADAQRRHLTPQSEAQWATMSGEGALDTGEGAEEVQQGEDQSTFSFWTVVDGVPKVIHFMIAAFNPSAETGLFRHEAVLPDKHACLSFVVRRMT